MDLTHFWNYVNDGAETLVLAVGSWAIAWGKHWLETRAKFLSVQTDQVLADRADQILRQGIAMAMAKLGTVEPKSVEGKGLLVNTAGQYLVDHAPQIIDHFGLSPEQIANMVIARLPSASTGVDTTGVTAPHVVVESAPLGAIK